MSYTIIEENGTFQIRGSISDREELKELRDALTRRLETDDEKEKEKPSAE